MRRKFASNGGEEENNTNEQNSKNDGETGAVMICACEYDGMR